jgi:uncharacterized ferritin-like protein (DUF455 family)
MSGERVPTDLTSAACLVLQESEPTAKALLTGEFAAAWRANRISEIGNAAPPDRPARPGAPELLPPRQMPRRKTKGTAGRQALMHAIAHIELNAIDLAWDLIARFASQDLPPDYYDDWVGVANDEARHFTLLQNRLAEMDTHYGAFPAHDGLWEAATDTADDLAARLAVVPLVLEARALDITPTVSARLRDAGDTASADILDLIANEEIAHVAAGVRWFRFICQRNATEPVATYQRLVRARFKGQIKPPFATESRAKADLPPAFYESLADRDA